MKTQYWKCIIKHSSKLNRNAYDYKQLTEQQANYLINKEMHQFKIRVNCKGVKIVTVY